MLSFACKKIQMEEIIRCGFDLNKTSYKTLSYMIKKNEWESISSIAKFISLERSGVQKAIKLLAESGLVERRQKNIPSGGYVYLYRSVPKEKMMELLMDIIDVWNKALGVEAEKWVN